MPLFLPRSSVAPAERASLCLSAGAFLLSACALLVSLGYPGGGGGASLATREPPPLNYVSLGNLLIQPVKSSALHA